jgi:hypothetical protein
MTIHLHDTPNTTSLQNERRMLVLELDEDRVPVFARALLCYYFCSLVYTGMCEGSRPVRLNFGRLAARGDIS